MGARSALDAPKLFAQPPLPTLTKAVALPL